MAGKLTGTSSLKVTRWAAEDWEWLAEVSKSVGLSRSDFVREAALAAAMATANGMPPYFVGGPVGTTQNTRINNSGPQSKAKGDGIGDASDRRRMRGVAKGADDAAKKKRGPEV